MCGMTSSCENYHGYIHPETGYGRRRYRGKTTNAHRVRFFEVFGWWPEVVRHTCDNRACINPWHLLPGTHADNTRDMYERNRTRGMAVTLNAGMPSDRTDHAAYEREKRARIKAGTWKYRGR